MKGAVILVPIVIVSATLFWQRLRCTRPLVLMFGPPAPAADRGALGGAPLRTNAFLNGLFLICSVVW